MPVKTKTSFVSDLADGQAAELRVKKYLGIAEPSCTYVQSQGKEPAYDLCCIIHGELLEVKHDKMAPRTGNICFERNLFGKTKAARVVYVVGDKAYFFDTKELWQALKELASSGQTKFQMLGDGWRNPAVLVKQELVLPLAIEVELEN